MVSSAVVKNVEHHLNQPRKLSTFGPFEIKNVIAVIAPNLNQPLLGMNVLQQLKIAQEKGEMRLSTRE